MTLKHKIQSIFPTEQEIPESYRLTQLLDQKTYLKNGELVAWHGDSQPVFSPVCIKTSEGHSRKLLGRFPLLTAKESLEALEAAYNAYDNGQGLWPTMSVEERIRHLQRFVEAMVKRREEVVSLLMWEIGKSATDSAKEFDRTVIYIKDTINALKELDRQSSRLCIENGIIAQIRRAPLGIVLCMGPFNYPLNETFTTLIPALIMGNTVVFKPAKLGVLLLSPLLEAFRDCFPKGVVNIIYGRVREIITPIMQSGKISCLAFIGSTKVADILKSQHPHPHKLRSVLGLAAKNPAIILPDADLELTVNECVLGSLSFNGQRCTALKIIFVHQTIADVFLDKLSQTVQSLKIGMPWEEGVALTPLPEDDSPQRLTGYIEDAIAKGATAINPEGGTCYESFVYPAILYPVNPQMKIYHEEQFGPIIAVCPYSDISEPINYIINSPFGQQASIFGQDSSFIAKMIDPLVNQVCRVNINSQCQRGPDTFPFTGRKDSAEGTLSVTDALRVFSIRTLVAAKETTDNKNIISEILHQRKSKFLSDDFIL